MADSHINTMQFISTNSETEVILSKILIVLNTIFIAYITILYDNLERLLIK